MSQTLQPMALRFSGRHLIEASAGTGKTYTITSLVLRLVLGVGVERPLNLGQILIVTFTRAATEELRARVRSRLAVARAGFEQGHSDDDFVARLIGQCEPETALRQLRLAELELDLASIYTIHGFAQSTLQQYAFESGAAFGARLDEHERRLRDEVALDIWRERVYPLGSAATDAVLQRFADASVFMAELAQLCAHEQPVFVGEPEADWDTLQQSLEDAVIGLKAHWCQHAERNRAALADFSFKKAGQEALNVAWRSLDQLVAGDAIPDPAALRILLADRLSDELNQRKHKDVRITPLPVEAPLRDLLAACDALPLRLLVDGATLFRERLLQRKRERNVLGFDDLLRLLDDGLSGPGADRLAAVLREQYPVAMIDEFQDTDPVQWRVFSSIYQKAGSLLLIGDPKQAIYRFRGADIYAYISARRATGQQHMLDTNYRSVAGLVDALNDLFRLRRDGDPFLAGRDIPFVPVQPCEPGRPGLICDDVAPSPLTILRLRSDKALGSTVARERLASACASHLADLLTRARRGQASIEGRALHAGDVAILVRGRHEAALLRPALKAAGIDWVYQSRESVYGQTEAADIHAILEAVIARGEERLLRSALARSLLCMDVTELEQLRVDDAALFEHQQRFEDFHDLLRRDGVLAMLRAVLFRYGVVPRLLAEVDGERRLTDALHIAELLQLERESLDGDEALLARLDDHIRQPDGDNESQQLRLESDSGRVQIITMHASKGLEYPVVYVPFPWSLRPATTPTWNDPVTLERFWDLGAAQSSLDAADRERLAEDVRLLYVAFTRAKQMLVTSLAQVEPRGNEGKVNAFDHLLDVARDDHYGAAARLAAINGVQVLDVDTLAEAVLPGETAAVPTQAVRAFAGTIRDDWRIHSYTSLTRMTSAPVETVFRQPEIARERLLPVAVSSADRSLIGFPRGAAHGSFLHALLEHADFESVARGVIDPEPIGRAMKAANYDADWEPVLEGMLRDVLGAALDGEALRLAALPAEHRHAEMAFDLALGSFDGRRLDALLRERGLLDASAPQLDVSHVRGLLTGFIDLVFCYRGRYFVADYKSNYLGPTRADYDQAAMQRSVTEHRYDLQYLIYSVALERHLRQRLGAAYDPDQHYGGAYYLYLRGISADAGDGYGIFHARPDDELRARVDELLGGGR